jgi:hypothetical protein
MASTIIRNLLNNNIDKVIVRAKSEVKNESKKEITKLKENIPSPEDLKEQIVTSACSAKAQSKIERIFNKNKSLLDKLNNRLKQSKEKLAELDNKLNKVRNIIDKIKEILQALGAILIALEIIVRVAPAGLAASSGPAASGIIIDRLGKAIDYGKAKIKEYGSLTKAILANLPKYAEKALAILAIIGAAILALNMLITLIDKLIVFLQFLYAKYIENCTVSDQSPINNEGLLNEDLLLANENINSGIADQMSTYYDDLLQTLSEGGYTLQAQRIYKVINSSDLLQKSYSLIETPKTI